MNYKGFEIIKKKYIEEGHPWYNYLSFTAICNEKYLYVVFRDTDMRVSTEEELLKIFISRLNEFVEYNTDTSVRHSLGNDNIVRPAENKESVELQNKESTR